MIEFWFSDLGWPCLGSVDQLPSLTGHFNKKFSLYYNSFTIHYNGVFNPEPQLFAWSRRNSRLSRAKTSYLYLLRLKARKFSNYVWEWGLRHGLLRPKSWKTINWSPVYASLWVWLVFIVFLISTILILLFAYLLRSCNLITALICVNQTFSLVKILWLFIYGYWFFRHHELWVFWSC